MTRSTLRISVALAAILLAGFPGGPLAAQVTRDSGFAPSKDPVYEAMVNKIGAKPEAESQLPLDAVFTDHHGQPVTLSKYINGDRPVILNLTSLSCSTSCIDITKKLVETTVALDWTLGREYDVVTVSFDDADDPEVAAFYREESLELYGREVSADTWPHLTGTEANIRRLTDSVSFHYQWNEAVGQYAHPSVVYLITPAGKLSRYYEGTHYGPTDIKFSLVDAGEGKVGSVWDRLSLFCLSWDPTTGQWVSAARRVMAVGAGLTLLLLGTTIFLAARARKRRSEPSLLDGAEHVSLGTQP